MHLARRMPYRGTAMSLSLIHIYSEQRRISGDGYYYVMETEHLGNTRDNDWYTDVLCLATDATLYPGDLGRAGMDGDAAKSANVVK